MEVQLIGGPSGYFYMSYYTERHPSKVQGNEDTLASVVAHSLKFPESPMVSFHARDLIRGLLVKEPENRLGSVKGASEIKQHSFFEGLNWALIRCAIPPEMPKLCDVGAVSTGLNVGVQKKDGAKFDSKDKDIDTKDTAECVEFELF